MAGKRKAEGIALLSVYGGEDDASQASGDEDDNDETPERQHDSSSQAAQGQDNETTATGGMTHGRVSATARGLGIVDYAQDEGWLAVSPEPEDGEILLSGRAVDDDHEVQPENGSVQESPSVLRTSADVSTMKPENMKEVSSVVALETSVVQDCPTVEAEGTQNPEPEAMEVDMLKDFLPPVPPTKYSGELQTKFAKYLALKKTGKSLNEQLRNTKGYRNPDFLQSAVRHYDIDHIGSCFKKEVFDPHGYEQNDYFDSIALEIRREAERKELERRQSQRVDFVRSSIQGAVAVAKPIISVVQKVVTVSSTDTSVKVDGRSSKKSKWDKVELEGSRVSQSLSTAVDAIAAVSAHAALLTASANAGAGYASFAQQRRREAEEKMRASEKNSSSKLERKTERS